MTGARVTEIQRADLDEVSQFLHENLNRAISPTAWKSSFQHAWAAAVPNHGMQLRHEGRLVGVFCAIYSDQEINGRVERFCNPHSWCVLPEYRNQSIGLILPLLKQPGYNFTMFTPNAKVAEVFRGLKFRTLEPGLTYFVNVPFGLRSSRSGGIAEDSPERIPGLLGPDLQRAYASHRDIPWLRFVAFGRPGNALLLAYKKDRVKHIPIARIIYSSDPGGIERHRHLIGRYFLMRRGLLLSRIESRFLDGPVTCSIVRKRDQPKLVKSHSLADHQVVDLYSELAALDV